jgi:hypothetical protein
LGVVEKAGKSGVDNKLYTYHSRLCLTKLRYYPP